MDTADDLVFNPEFQAWRARAADLGATRILFIGTTPEAVPEYTLRTANPPPLGIPPGAYFFKIDGAWSGLVVAGEPDGSPAWSGRLDRIEDGHPAVMAWRWFTSLWESGTPVGPRPGFDPGAVVRIEGTDDTGTVVKPGSWTRDQYVYTVRVGAQQKLFPESSLSFIDLDVDDPEQWILDPPASAEDTALRLSYYKMVSGFSDTIYSYGSTKTVFRPYQFKPVLRLKDSVHKRLLIADEVGLGKTIEAGLIWTELDHRAHMNRVLIVCPSMLVRKWRDEMRRRFGRTVRVLDRMALDEMVDLFQRGDEITPLLGVVSLERLRGSEQLERLQDTRPTFDLVIVDEAHYMRNPETATHDLGQLLSDWADSLIFLSATPLNLGRSDLFSLVNLLLPAEFADQTVFEDQLKPNARLTAAGKVLSQSRAGCERALAELRGIPALPFGDNVARRPEYTELVGLLSSAPALSSRGLAQAKRLLGELHTLSGVVTRTRKVDVPEQKAVREPRTIHVDWTDEERRFYDAVRAWATKRAKAKGAPPGFFLQMPLRQTASCIPAMIDRLDQPDLDEDDDMLASEIDADDADDDRLPEDLLAELRSMASSLNGDTKFDQFFAALQEAQRQGISQFMVFSFFKRTLGYLAGRLARYARVAVMHGDIPVEERERIMAAFRAGQVDLLLLSEVGSEGLDFEFCNALFNYDLPWNPMRVEQRIGRLDRFGQKHEKIFVYNFEVPGTIETDIFGRLYERLRVFEESIGELEPVLRDDFADLPRLAVDPRLTDAQREQRIRQLEVAFEARAREIDDLRASEAELVGIDQLLVEGLEADIEEGKYVGPNEVRNMLTALLNESPGCTLDFGDDGDVGRLVGSSDLSRRMLRTQRSSGSSMYTLGELARLLSDSEPIDVTFDSSIASSAGVELISAGHPLVLTALEQVGSTSRLQLARFGRARVSSCPRGTYCMMVYVLEVTGLRPIKRLWPVVIDTATGEVREDVANICMAALARGEMRSTSASGPVDLNTSLVAAREHLLTEMEAVKVRQREENERILAGRLAALRAEVEHKTQRAMTTLRKVSEARARRIYEGRIRNLAADLERRTTELEAKKGSGVSVTPVSVVLVRGG
jgi:superfamily II DNA or RNA helicase